MTDLVAERIPIESVELFSLQLGEPAAHGIAFVPISTSLKIQLPEAVAVPEEHEE